MAGCPTYVSVKIDLKTICLLREVSMDPDITVVLSFVHAGERIEKSETLVGVTGKSIVSFAFCMNNHQTVVAIMDSRPTD